MKYYSSEDSEALCTAINLVQVTRLKWERPEGMKFTQHMTVYDEHI